VPGSQRIGSQPVALVVDDDVRRPGQAQHQVDAGPPDQVEARLQTLLAPDGPYRALALEARAWLLMRTGDNTQARDILQGLTKDSAVPEGVRGRANGLLARMGDPAAAGAQ